MVRRLEPLPGSLTVIGELVGLIDRGQTPVVTYAAQPGSAALRAKSLVDLCADHIGGSVALTFADGDPSRPIILGLVRERFGKTLEGSPGHVEVEADGDRLIVTAQEQIVLRCGLASITLTSAGKVLIEGAHVVSRSSGAQRIKGGSVQIN